MKTLRYTLIILLGITLTVVLTLLEQPIWLIYICVLVLYGVILVIPQLYVVYKSTNLKRIERYLLENKRKPLFAYPLAVKTGEPDQIKAAIQTILTKHKQPYMQQVYKTNLALHENNVSRIEQLAKQISKEPLRTYYIAYAEALKGNIPESRALKEALPAGWMPHAIEAIIAKIQGNMKIFREEADASVACARGVQKLQLYYSFENMEREIL